ncbi:lipopolysaccharide kinase InaA family protein [Jejudonia soesokkakensis]|uniref:Lipopolysaccharide kinase InaA family protein n=1 Tax=Jejudonia soesokkakensis TaxID=1323432 RepID=A0ABW2MX05_9FLAO
MKVVFSEKYELYKEDILTILNTFPQGGKSLKEGGRNTLKVYEVGAIPINIKSFKVPNAINKVAYRFFRKSKAKRSFEYASLLLEKGIGTPAPIGYVEDNSSVSFGKSFYISEHLEPDLTFRKLIREPDYPDHENILRQFTQFTLRLHDSGVLFKDHSPGNTLIRKNGKDYEFFLVDLNRMQFKELTFGERIQNFSRLTPKKDMVAIMSDEYAKNTTWKYDAIFSLMWKETTHFQEKFHRKKRLKKKLLFWRN